MAELDELVRREAVLLANGADQKARTVPLTLSTEHPVDRGSFEEILGHEPGEVDLSRAPLPLIESHDAERLPIGVIENLHLAGRRLRGLARFGSSARAKEVFADIADGVIRNVSVGYRYLGEPTPVGKRGLRFRWQPMELSAVSVGADPNAGFMRKGNTMLEYQGRTVRRALDRERKQFQLATIPPADRRSFQDHLEALAEEGDEPNEDMTREYRTYREQAIRGLAEMSATMAGQDLSALAELSIVDEQMTVDGFRKKVLKMVGERHKTDIDTGRLELDRQDPYHQVPGSSDGYGYEYGGGARVTKRYSNLQAFKGADAERRAHACGMFFRSLVGDTKARSWCQEHGITGQRVMTEGVFTAGGALVPDIVANEIISNAEQFGVFRRFARIWPMTSASLAVPVSGQGLSLAAVGETTATPTSDLSLRQITLTAKEFAGGTRVSKSLLEDSAVALGDFLIREFGRALGQIEDQCGFTADGTSTYGGMEGIIHKLENVAAHAGSKKNAASGHDTFAEIDIADLTALMGIVPEYARAGAAWYVSASAKDAIFTRLVASAGGNNTETMRQGAGESFLGYPVRTSQVLPSDAAATYNGDVVVLFGNLALASAFGDRRALDAVIDMSRFIDYRQVYVQVTERFDVNNHMVGSTATACGPIAGLLGTT